MGAVSNNWFDCFYSQFSNPHVDRCSNPLPWEPFSSPQSTGARQIQAKYVDRVIPNVGAPCPISSAATEQPPKGTNGVSTNGVTANVVFFDRVTFRVLPLTYFYLPKSDRAYLFSQSVKIHYFCGSPISVDPIRPQPTPGSLAPG